VEPARWIAANIHAGNRTVTFEELRPELGLLARIADDQLTFKQGEPDHSEQAVTVVAADVVATMPLAGMVDLDVERARLEKELEAAQQEQERATASLNNEAFVSRAPARVVEQQRNRLRIANEQIEVLTKRLAMFNG
ncbi:MAG TPA: valine--tRNA ligase, partial [Thermomicrobiales bacterium]|nr:valine--tRNA ligase [Thermomicrobiales bacterium]